ncbi:MAG: heme o synthase [Phycisphaerales bacterium]|nr:heme o synthase [Phycisphaerales bacterium]
MPPWYVGCSGDWYPAPLAMPDTDVDPATTAPPPSARLTLAALPGLYADLVKFRLSLLVVATAAVGVFMAAWTSIDWAIAGWTVLGTMLCAASANAFNQVIEYRRDKLMERTMGRPVPSGRMSPWHGWLVAALLGYAGAAVLAILVNELACALAVLTLLLYVLCYTPLKSRSTLNTLVGAVVGAIPPLIGWAAVRNSLSSEAWMLAALLFMWQLPHFLALAWILRDQYAGAGFRMLPISPGGEHATCEATLMSTLLLIPLSLLATLMGMAGWIYAVVALVLGCWWTWRAFVFFKVRDRATARRVFLASLLYLPLILTAMVLDRNPITDTPEVMNRMSAKADLQ